jgi:hypothetical protein
VSDLDAKPLWKVSRFKRKSQFEADGLNVYGRSLSPFAPAKGCFHHRKPIAGAKGDDGLVSSAKHVSAPKPFAGAKGDDGLVSSAKHVIGTTPQKLPFCATLKWSRKWAQVFSQKTFAIEQPCPTARGTEVRLCHGLRPSIWPRRDGRQRGHITDFRRQFYYGSEAVITTDFRPYSEDVPRDCRNPVAQPALGVLDRSRSSIVIIKFNPARDGSPRLPRVSVRFVFRGPRRGGGSVEVIEMVEKCNPARRLLAELKPVINLNWGVTPS